MANDLQKAGSAGPPTKFGILHQDRIAEGLWTQSSPLRDASSPYLQTRFYGSRYDRLIDGANVEITNKLTLARRPGNSVYNSQTFNPIKRFYSYRNFTGSTETICLLVDEANAVYEATAPTDRTLVFTKGVGAGQTSFLSVGNALYMGDGVEVKQLNKCPGSGGTVSNWGTAGPVAAPGDAPLAYLGAPCRYWAPGMLVQAGYAIRDSNGNVQLMTGNQNAASSFTTTVPAQTFNNGTVPVNLPVAPFGGGPITVNPFTNPQKAFDGNPNTSATAVFQGTAQIGVCTWNFTYSGATPTSLTLNVMSGANAPVMSGSPMWASVWYTLDAGTTWTAIWQENAPNVRAMQWNAIPLLAGQNIANVQVCAYMESHDNAGEQVAEINLVVGTATIPTAITGDKTTGTVFPTWSTALYGLTTDNTAIWQNMGPAQQWQAKTVYSLTGPTAAVLDSNGNLQVLQATGVSGTTQPTWATGAGATTTDGTLTWLNVGPGATVAFSGWTYVYAYHTTSGNVSTASPESQPTGPVLGTIQVLLSGVGSADPGCDKVYLFRTLDGGANLLFLDSINNPGGGVTWTFTDTHPDSDLNEFLLAPIALGNNPPPAGLVNLEYHLGRIWGSVGNTVYYSRAADATAGSALESFPPSNSFVFPSQVTRMWAGPAGLMVFTVSDVYLIVGQATASSPVYAVPFLQGIGLLSYNALDVNGSIVYLFTADAQLISFDPNAGIPEIGFPIGDLLAGLNPANVYVTWHVSGSADKALYVGDGATGWYRMNPTSAPENGLCWSPKATLVGGCSAIQSIEITPGVKRLLIGPAATGPLLKRDPTVFTDNGTAYVANATFGSIILALPGQLSEISFITTDAMAVGTRPTLAVRMDEISGALASLTNFVNDPPELVASSTIYGNRYYFNQTQQPAWCRHMQMQVSWPAENFKNELLAFTIFGASKQER